MAAKKKNAQKTLVIVESPTKAQTIEKYLGPGYTVKASQGHLIDLPKSRLAVDVDNNFQPEYITVRGKAKLLKELQKEAKKVSKYKVENKPDKYLEAGAPIIKDYKDYCDYLSEEPGKRVNTTEQQLLFNLKEGI